MGIKNAETAHGASFADWHFDKIKVLPDIVRYWAALRPEKTALIAGDFRWSYAELDQRSEQVAIKLIAENANPGTTIGYLGKNTLAFFELWFGIAKAECTLVPFNWRSTVNELVEMVSDASPRMVFATGEFVETLREARTLAKVDFSIITIDEMQGVERWSGPASGMSCTRSVQPSDVALISYTSGTSGTPKGVMATHEAFAYSFLCGVLEPSMALIEGDVMLMSMPNFHLGGSWVSIAALYHGQTLSLLPAFEPKECLNAIARDRVTIAPLVPAAIQMMLDLPDAHQDAFSSLRSIIYFGSPISGDLLTEAIDRIGCELSQYYGATEAWFLTILRHADHVDAISDRLGSCGRPLPLVSLRIEDPDGVEVLPGEIGEVLVRTPMMLAGYRNRPNDTAEALRNGWYHTGDLGRCDAEGYLYIVDRAKDMVISGGENVYSIEVERALAKLPGVKACAVVGLPDAKWGERVVAAIICEPDSSLSFSDVIVHCRGLIARYKVPKQVVFVQSLPLTSTGKVRKATLREQLVNAL